jgi:hypothetical protein
MRIFLLGLIMKGIGRVKIINQSPIHESNNVINT